MSTQRVAAALILAGVVGVFGATSAAARELHIDQNIRVSGDCFMPGTDLMESFVLGDLDTVTGPSFGKWRPGDRLQLKCTSFTEVFGVPCDSVVLRVELGRGQLPVGIELALLGLAFDPGLGHFSAIDWDFPLENQGRALDRRFMACGPGERVTYFTRVQVLSADTTGRSIRIGLVAAERAAVLAYRAERWDRAASACEDVLATRRDDPAWEVVYAGALKGAGWQRQYAHQVQRLAALGLAAKSREAVSVPRR